ncbi:MAG: phage integrase SAM-like domain-containing protein, partial [Bacteroidota bacterium]|nr:phage integrase SAM-like domain-containing protein [Bacteroidota bacterium]
LCDLELKLKQDNLSINTISIILRNMRAVFNFAITNEIISSDCYPFRRYKIKQEETRKRALSLEQMRALINLHCDSDKKSKFRDIFLLMVYLIGINTKDLLNLKEITNGRIEYKRCKTGRLYSIKVEPEAMAIINKYRGSEFLLDIDNRNNFANHFDKVLKKLGNISYDANNRKELVSIEPMLSSYYARHSWGYICLRT